MILKRFFKIDKSAEAVVIRIALYLSLVLALIFFVFSGIDSIGD